MPLIANTIFQQQHFVFLMAVFVKIVAAFSTFLMPIHNALKKM
jgi:hypothetical protein